MHCSFTYMITSNATLRGHSKANILLYTKAYVLSSQNTWPLSQWTWYQLSMIPWIEREVDTVFAWTTTIVAKKYNTCATACHTLTGSWNNICTLWKFFKFQFKLSRPSLTLLIKKLCFSTSVGGCLETIFTVRLGKNKLPTALENCWNIVPNWFKLRPQVYTCWYPRYTWLPDELF